MKKLFSILALIPLSFSVFSQCTVQVTHTNVACNGGCNGTATANASGGTSPYTYSWSTSPPQNTQTVTSLCAGNYTVMVSDAVGCTSTATVAISQPAAFSTTVSATAATCNGGNDGTAATAVAGGTPSYTYSWSNGATTTATTGLSAATYTVTVTDANGCTSSDTVSVTQPAVLVINSTSTSASCVTCSDGTASASTTGGASPYTYLWSNGQTTTTATGLTPDTYTVCVTDGNGCTQCDSLAVTFINGIYEAAYSDFIQVYPNPFSETTTLRITNGQITNYELKVYDLIGKEVFPSVIRNTDSFIISGKNMKGGIYFMKILSVREDSYGEENIIGTRKLIVE